MNSALRILSATAAAALVVVGPPCAASAEHRTTEHLTRTVARTVLVRAARTPGTSVAATAGPVVTDLPAGRVCDFAYHQEYSFTQNLERFFDEDGNLVRVEDKVALTVLHRNADTGYTLTETDHYAAFVDFVSGEATTTGQNWHLVDQDGRLVLTGAGSFTIDLITGEVLDETPYMQTAGRATICPALGGAPAA